jgi:hypothetical protein
MTKLFVTAFGANVDLFYFRAPICIAPIYTWFVRRTQTLLHARRTITLIRSSLVLFFKAVQPEKQT